MTVPEQEANGLSSAANYAGETVAAIAQAQTITAEEIALYDRQIRLWGVQAQERLRTAHVLLITIRALANEISKNLVLAGIGSITLIDEEAVTEEDLGSQFLVSEEDVGKNRAEAAATRLRKLNPRVSVHVDASAIGTKAPDYFSQFDMTICTSQPIEVLKTVNAHTRACDRPFYATDAHGFSGFIFADLIRHEFVIEREKSNVATLLRAETGTRAVVAVSTKRENGRAIEMVTKRETYSPLAQVVAAPLPSDCVSARRRRLQVSPLLTAFRALWAFEAQQQQQQGRLPSLASHADIELFTRLATEEHRALQLPPETLRSAFLTAFLQNVGSELAPVTAFLGGELAQDVINVLGQREQPIQNLLLFDGEESKGPIYAMHPRREGQ